MPNSTLEMSRPAEGQVLVGSSDHAEKTSIETPVTATTNPDKKGGFVSMHEDLSTQIILNGKDVGEMHDIGTTVKLPTGDGDNYQSTSLPAMVEGNYRLFMSNIYPYMLQEGRAPTPEEFEKTFMEHYQVYQEMAKRFPDTVKLIGSQKELMDSQISGKIGMILSNEGIYLDPTTREKSLSMAERMRKLGIFSFSLWNDPNALGSTQKDEKEGNDIGLTSFGRDFFQIVAGSGGIIDASHASAKTTEDFLKEYENVFQSHGGVKGENPHKRLLNPEHAKEIVRRNGLIGFNLHHGFVSPDPAHVRANIDHVIDRILEAAEVVGGTENFAIATDFGGLSESTIIAGASEASTVVGALRHRLRERRVLSDRQIEGIMVNNPLNYLHRVLPAG